MSRKNPPGLIELTGTREDHRLCRWTGSYEPIYQKGNTYPRFRCLIYSNQYGSEIIETLMDKEVTREYIEAEISFLVTDTLIHDPRVLRVYNVEIEFKDTYPMQDSCVITFDVDTIYGEIPVKEVI